jgi:cell division protein FtsN
MKELDNLPDSAEKKSPGIRFLRFVLVLVLFIAFAGALLFSWKKLTSSRKEVKKETVQIPVSKKPPEQDLTFYKNLKDKNEFSGKREALVGLIPPSTSPSRPPEPSPGNSLKRNPPDDRSLSPRFTLQVASMRDHHKALHLSERLAKKGFPSYVIPAEIPEKGTYYRVRIGHYVTRKSAEGVLEQLKQRGEKEAIIAKENVMTRTK